MAVTLERQFSINVSAVVEQSIDAAKSVRRAERARQEAEFQRAIADGLSYEEQVKLRQQQLDKEKTSSFKDDDYVAQLEKSIADTKKLSRFNRYRERYANTLADLSSGKINEEQYLNTLKTSLNGVTDPDLRLEIQNNISEAEGVLKNYRQTILANQVKKAKFDGTQKSLSEAIASVRNARSQALISDNQDEVTAYDETLSALESQLFGVRTQDSLTDFQVQSSTRGVSPIEKLNFINSQLSQSDASRPIRIGNVSYRSAQEFWTLERDGFLGGTSQNFGDFFGELQTFVENRVNSDVVRVGYPPQATLDDVLNTFNTLKARPEVAPFANRFDIIQATVLANSVDKFAKKVMDVAEETLQFQLANEQIKNLGERYGIDTRLYSSQLFQRVRGLEQGNLVPQGSADQLLGETGLPTIEKPKSPAGAPTPPSAAPAAPTGGTVRTVQRGDTLSAIAQAAGLSLAQVLEANPQFRANPNLIRPGQQVNLPSAVPVAEPETPAQPAQPATPPQQPPTTPPTTPPATPAVPATPAQSPAPEQPKPEPNIYQVQSGDTLSAIAQRLLGDASRWRELKSEGGQEFTEETAKKLQIGTKLVIPQ